MPCSLRILVIAALFAGNAAAAQQQKDPPLSSCEPSGSNTANGVRATCPDHPFAQPPKEALFPPLKKDFLAFSNNSARSQQSTNTQKPDVTIKSVFVNLPKDQATIWTSPFHIRPHDLYWLAPFAATSGVLLGSDTHSMAREQSNALAVHRSKQASNYGLAALIALPAATYLVGEFNGSSQARETGLLSGEAVVDSLIVNQVLKVITARARPTLTGGNGGFFKNATDGSFPSAHAMLGWTAASVIAHEYPGWLTQTLVYGAASAVSISRITARQHFPADVVVGGGLGWLIGRQVFKAHSQNTDDHIYGTFGQDEKAETESTQPRGSTFVPLDSWVYPALKRLAALGYIRTQFAAMEPWTKQECLRQLEEADYLAEDLPHESDIRQLVDSLKAEFSRGSGQERWAQIESVYTRYMDISGPPLRDSYHFGQTIYNDFGRPYDQGGNFVTGATASAVAGRFFFYVQGEYEHAPGRPALTALQQNLVNNLDGNIGPLPIPIGPQPAPVTQVDRFYPLDMYAGVQLGGYAVTFGKQSLWLGPGESAPLMVSDNADPEYMLRLVHTSAFYLPWFLRALGPVQDEYLFSKLSGHKFPARPFFNLQKISFHPTKNLEIGFTRASLWAGVGHPFTFHLLERNFLALGDTPPGPFNNPREIGDRKSGFDFSYRVPGLRNWLTIYSDSYSDDDPSPIANPRRAAVSPGIYLSHVPGIPKLDLRAEAVSTQSLTATDRGGQFLYWNFRYHDSNTNKGFLFGNSTGRDGRAFQGWSTYHFAPGKTLEFSYRQLKVGNGFLPGGGTQSDASTRLAWRVRPEWTVDTFVQYERWLIPSLLPTAQTDVSASIQLTYHPNWSVH
jgi:hypothetical protein